MLSGDSDRIQKNGMELQQESYSQDVGKRFFIEWVVMHWNRLPGAVVMTPSMSVFQKHLATLIYGHIFRWFCVDPRIGLNDPCGSLQTQDIL